MYVIQFRATGSTEWRTADQHGRYLTWDAATRKLAALWVVPGFDARVGKVAS